MAFKPHKLIDYLAPLVTSKEHLLLLLRITTPPYSLGFSTQVESTKKYEDVARQMLSIYLFDGRGFSALQLAILSQGFFGNYLALTTMADLQHMQLLIDLNEQMQKSLDGLQKNLEEITHERG